jgi:integrase
MATIERYETKSGATLYRVRYRTPEGRQTDRRGFATKREAQQWAATVEVSKMKGEYVAPSAGTVTVGQLGQAWLDRQRGHMKPSGHRSYGSMWRTHVQPRSGQVPIGQVRHSDVQGWVSELSTRKGPSVVRMCFGILSRILADAVKDRQLAANPCTGVKLPAKSGKRHVYLAADQLSHLADESGRYGSLVLLLGIGGLRWGEAAALRAGDIDPLRRRIHLHENAVTIGRHTYIGTLKTGHSRTVALPSFVTDALAATCVGKGRDELIWPSADGGHLGPPTTKSWLSGAVGRCQRTDPTFPRITAHDLRHTAASLAISSGASVLAVQRMLGHTSAAMTLDVYADLFESDADAVAENVGKMWARVGQ